MKLEEIRLGDVVRLRNGETFAVGSKSPWYEDAKGRHEGPFVADRGFRSRFLLADVVEVVVANPRRCVFCDEGVTAKEPDVDFCSHCFYDGRWFERSRAELLDRVRAVAGVKDVSVWHTGGGCFLLGVEFVDGRVATCDDSNAGLPEDGDYWRLVVVSENEEVWSEWDEDRMEIVEGEWNDEDLVATLVEVGRSS